ncbi:hypothetical protein [Halobacillus andaensis]|uniref:hypothetical protein n=1 Tax=Halobacillus andaensis TaxID=1176239 RepID=UPI003D713C63
MKHFYALNFILVLGLMLGACGNPDSPEDSEEPADDPTEEESSEDNGENVDEDESNELEPGVETVLQSVEEVGASLEEDGDVSTINEQGEALEKDWDQIEEDVEEQYPDRYTETEESLYPLIDEAKKDEPDVEKMEEWVQSTSDSLNELKDEIGTKE